MRDRLAGPLKEQRRCFSCHRADTDADAFMVKSVDGTRAIGNGTIGCVPLLQMSLQESALAGVVAAIYELTTSDRVIQAVPPDGLTGLILVDGRLWWFGPQTRPWQPKRSGVDVVGVRIALQWGHAVLGKPLHAYRDSRVPVDELWPSGSAFDVPSNPLDGTPLNRLIRVLNHLASQKTADPFTERMAGLVSTGEYTVADLADRLELSVRQLHRRSLTSFGLPPSTLLRINRLHQAAARVRRNGHPGLADLAVSAGYFDQAHLSRETRRLVGERPSKAFAVASNVRFIQYLR